MIALTGQQPAPAGQQGARQAANMGLPPDLGTLQGFNGQGQEPNTQTAGGGGQAVAGAGIGSYGPDDNLIGSSVLPMDSGALQGYNGQVQSAANNVANFTYRPFQSMGPLSGAGNTQYQNIANTGYQNAGQTSQTGAQGYMNTAAQQGGAGAAGQSALQGLLGGGGGAGGFSYGGPAADATAARGMTSDALKAAMTGPDRTQLAQQSFQLMRDQGQTGFEQDQRAVAQRAGALGRVGAGMTTNDLTGLAASRDKNLDYANRDLSLQAAQQTMQDRMDRTNLANGVTNTMAGNDRADAGLNLQGAALNEQSRARIAGNQLAAGGQLMGYDSANRNLSRGLGQDAFGMGATNTAERNNDANRNLNTDQYNTNLSQNKAQAQTQYDTNAYDRATTERNAGRTDEYNRDNAGQNRLSSLGNVQNNQRSFEANNRNEVRGERGYQNDQSNAAQNSAIQQQNFNEWMRNSGWGRTMGAAGAGFSGNPSGAYNAAAGQYQGQAAATGQAGANLANSLGNLNRQPYDPYNYNNGR